MKIAGINFPGALLNALRDGELVVFAGAGVSMGEPACLPSFKNLADMIAVGTGQALQDGDPIDHFLGRLQHEGVKVHERAAEALTRENLKATELHRNLLRLYSEIEQVRIVTTNFDLLFQKAADDLFGSVPEVFRAPALPLGHRFKGIVHVHGAINPPDEHGAISPPGEMIITDLDFGRAYLNEGWARRFLVELFSNFTILFVGYRHNDTIMNYLARALPAREANRRFALTGKCDDDTDRWRLLGIEPITYPQCNKEDHSALDEGVRELAAFAQLSVLDWYGRITMLAENPPSLDEETEDLIKYALADATRTRFFTEAATDPKWIDWLDQRGYLTPLFVDGPLSERDKNFGRWLVEQFAYNPPNQLFRLIDKHNMRLNPLFWHDLSWRIGRNPKTRWNKDILSRWILLLLNTVRDHIGVDEQANIATVNLLQLMGKCCMQHGMLNSLLQIFDVMTESRLRLKEGFLWFNDDENDESPPVDLELILVSEHKALNDFWDEVLKPKRSEIAEPLLDRVVKRLEERYIILRTWQGNACNWQLENDEPSVIDAHDMVRYIAYDCLEYLAAEQLEVAVRWCDRLVRSDAPLLRRLAMHGLSKREDLTADNKIDWLLTHIDLYESPVRRAVFQAVELAYPQASSERRQALIEAVRAYRWPDEEDPKNMEHTARQHFYWFDRLHKSDSKCPLARQALDKILGEYPEFKWGEPVDIAYSDSSDWGSPQSPWTPEELLAKSVADWLDDLLSFQDTELNGPNRIGLLQSVAAAARTKFDWGLDLADVLSETEKWDVDLWPTLIRTWSRMELDENRHSIVLGWLGKTELYPKHSREIADALYGLVKHDVPAYALNLLSRANKIAEALWCRLDRNESIEESDDWSRSASSHPAGSLTNFWLFGFHLWREHQDPKPTVLSEECCTALSRIMNDQSLSGKLGKTVLANKFAYLLDVDKTWTQDNLLPLFGPGNDDFYVVWDGFLFSRILNPTGGKLNLIVAEAMADRFFKAVEQINSNRFNQRDQFIQDYIDILAHFVEDPIDEWIPKLFQYTIQKTPSTTTETTHIERQFLPHDVQGIKTYFASEVRLRLHVMDEVARQEWWRHWLKRYWKNRSQGVPGGEFESGEVANMLDWLPYLGTVFPEAVDLAVQMPQRALQNCSVIEELSRSDEINLWQRHPESVAKLLIYLRKCNLPRHSWYSVRDLINQLLLLNISQESRQGLKKIRIQL